MWWFLRITHPNMHSENHLWVEKKIIGSLASHIGILDDEFEDILDACKLSKVWYWYKYMGLHVQTHRYHSIT